MMTIEQATDEDRAQLAWLDEKIRPILAEAKTEGIPLEFILAWWTTWAKEATMRQGFGPMGFIDWLAGCIQLDCQMLGADAQLAKAVEDFANATKTEH